MKLRALGTGNPFCRHPLVAGSFLIQSDTSNVVIGCGAQTPSKLEAISLSSKKIDMWLITHVSQDQVGGLPEVGAMLRGQERPYLAAPEAVLREIRDYFFTVTREKLETFFSVQGTSKVTINEEHHSETIHFVNNHHSKAHFGVVFEEAQVFLSGHCQMNDDFLHQYGAPSKIILHSCQSKEAPFVGSPISTADDLRTLPMYLQAKTWLYSYSNSYLSEEEPIPMLYLPQGSCIYDSARKDKHLEKERFIRENSKRVAGNLAKESRL